MAVVVWWLDALSETRSVSDILLIALLYFRCGAQVQLKRGVARVAVVIIDIAAWERSRE